MEFPWLLISTLIVKQLWCFFHIFITQGNLCYIWLFHSVNKHYRINACFKVECSFYNVLNHSVGDVIIHFFFLLTVRPLIFFSKRSPKSVYNVLLNMNINFYTSSLFLNENVLIVYSHLNDTRLHKETNYTHFSVYKLLMAIKNQT